MTDELVPDPADGDETEAPDQPINDPVPEEPDADPEADE